MEPNRIRRRNLPHWDVPGATYFVTTCLQGSIPAQGLVEIAHSRNELARRSRPAAIAESAWKVHCWKLVFVKIEEWLDVNAPTRWLENATLAQQVESSMLFFAGTRYDLLAYVVMPSHIHWLFRPLESWIRTIDPSVRSPRERVTYGMNRYSATACNRLPGRKGPFWQTESYDHWVRDSEELERIIHYIENNPCKARLVTEPSRWRFSSAWLRTIAKTNIGDPLPNCSPSCPEVCDRVDSSGLES